MKSIVREYFTKLYPQYQQKTQKKTEKRKNEAVLLVDNSHINEFNRRKSGVSSWNFENRFDKNVNITGEYTFPLTNTTAKGYVNINRDFEVQTDGIITLEGDMDITNAANGARVYLSSSDGSTAIDIVTKNGVFVVVADKEYTSDIPATDGNHVYKIVFNLDTKCGHAAVDGVKISSFTNESVKDLGKVFLSTSSGYENLSIYPKHLYIYKNFAVNEIFPTLIYPYDWEESKAYPVRDDGDRYKTCSLKFDTDTEARKNFDTLTGKVLYENFFYMPNKEDECNIHIGDALTVKVTNEKITCKELCHTFKHTVWQCLHVEADGDGGKAVIFINGKKRAEVAIDKKEFNYISFDFKKNSPDGYLLIDDVKVHNLYDYEDYCPKPEKVSSKDYNLIMSVCSLWHEGTHYGWDCVSPYDECTPLMGYYDEGIPESADWETKYMVEHGINAMQYCWYATNSHNYTVPIKRPALDWQQHYGYFYGKYSDMLKFCFMWENAGFGWNGMTLEQFKSYLWDYWVEWYFRDDRYFTIDNKIFFHVYRDDMFYKTFGSVEKCKEVLDFMREEIKKYGYDGMIIVANGSNLDRSAEKVKLISDMGFDGICQYAWSKPSFNPLYLRKVNEGILGNIKKSESDLFLVPTVATGRSSMGWFDTRSPLANKEQHTEVLEYYKEIIAKQQNNHGLIYFSTWNEYGEGHWLAPNGFNGFTNNDLWRDLLTDAPKEHTDIVPTENQMARICHLYNDSRTPIRSWLQKLPDISGLDTEVLYKAEMNLDMWYTEECDILKCENGEISVKSTGVDTKIILKDDINIKALDFDYIHIRMKSSSIEDLMVYYTTMDDERDEFTHEKHLDAIVFEAGKYIDYYLPAIELQDKNNEVLRNVRIDPSNNPDIVSEIDCFEIIRRKKNDSDFDLYVDGVKLHLVFYEKFKEDGEYYVMANPRQGVFSATNFYHLWNRFTGKLYIKTPNDTEFVFTRSSDVVLVNGKEQKLPKPFTTHDKVPVLPFTFILDNAGIKYEVLEDSLQIHIR